MTMRDDKPATRKDLASLGWKIHRRFETVDKRFDAVDKRFGAVDRRFDALEAKVDKVAAIASNASLSTNDMRADIKKLLAGQAEMLARFGQMAGKWIDVDRSYVTLHDRVGKHDRPISALEASQGRNP